MKINKFLKYNLLILILISGCAASKVHILDSNEQQVELRTYQTRVFKTTDKHKTMKCIMNTMQDLQFVIDMVNLELGTITGTKFTRNKLVKISVNVRSKNESQLLVRINAQYGSKPIVDPEPYKYFFNHFEKSLFLAANKID